MSRVYLHGRPGCISDAALTTKLAEDEEKEREAMRQMVEEWSDEDAEAHMGVVDDIAPAEPPR